MDKFERPVLLDLLILDEVELDGKPDVEQLMRYLETCYGEAADEHPLILAMITAEGHPDDVLGARGWDCEFLFADHSVCGSWLPRRSTTMLLRFPQHRAAIEDCLYGRVPVQGDYVVRLPGRRQIAFLAHENATFVTRESVGEFSKNVACK